MASGHTPTNAQLCRRFQRGLQILLDTFYDTVLLYTQDIQVVNFYRICKCNHYVQGCRGKVSEIRSIGEHR